MLNKKEKENFNHKLNKIRVFIADLFKELTNLYKLGVQEIDALKSNLQNTGTLVFKKSWVGRSYHSIVRVVNEMFIKREIFLLTKNNVQFDNLKPWLKLNEIVLKERDKYFGGYQNKMYYNIVQIVVNHPSFCYEDQIQTILNSPDIFLRMKFLLDNFNNELKKEVLDFIKRAVSQGYVISGKSVKGVLGGGIYLFRKKKKKFPYTQEKIATMLDTTSVTMRRRLKELNKFASLLG